MARLRPGPTSEQGFTLVELLVTMMILGIISAIVVVSVVGSMRRTTVAANRTNALVDIERGLERMSREIRVADPLVIDPDGSCDSMTTADCVDEVLTRRMDAVTFRGGEQVNHSYYLVELPEGVELRQDTERVDPATGTVTSTSTGEFIAEIANLDPDPTIGRPLFRFLREDPVTKALVDIDCTGLTVPDCRTAYGTASVVEITLMKVLDEGDPLRVSTVVNIRNTRYRA